MEYQMTYERVSAESAAFGDVAEGGFYLGGGWQYPLHGCEVDEEDIIRTEKDMVAGEFDIKYEKGDLKHFVQNHGCGDVEVFGRDLRIRGWNDEDFVTGDYTTVTFHMECSSAASAHRMGRAAVSI